jgi:ATP-binding cassette subfamily C protein CydCD
VQVRYRPGGPLALDGLDLDLPVRRLALTADLLTVTAGRATLLITHEPDGLDQVDEIIVLDRGRVAQRGMHRELAAADGPYRRLQRSRTARASR